MSWNPSNAFAAITSEFRRILTGEEVLQGVLNAAQNAANVALIDSAGLPISPSNPLPSGTSAKQYSTAPSNSAPITTAADITLVAGDKLFVQNLDTDPLFVRRGTGATSGAFNYVLQGGGAADDGTGGAIIIDDFIGVVSFAGTTVRYNAWKA